MFAGAARADRDAADRRSVIGRCAAGRPRRLAAAGRGGTGARLRPALALLALTGAGLWTAALFLPRSSAERPASFSIDYFRDADHQTASWGILQAGAAARQLPRRMEERRIAVQRARPLDFASAAARYANAGCAADSMNRPEKAAGSESQSHQAAAMRSRSASPKRRSCSRSAFPQRPSGSRPKPSRRKQFCAARAGHAKTSSERPCLQIVPRWRRNSSLTALACRRRASRFRRHDRAMPSRNIRPTKLSR